MTFTEAAEAVLRKMGKALHVKKITQLAIDENLLSHVGKTPEVTMSTRLATLTKKDRGDQSIVRVRPGVFGLREWGNSAPVDADAANEPDVETAEADEAPVAQPVAAAKPAAPAPAQRPRNDGRGGQNERRDGKGAGNADRPGDKRNEKRDARGADKPADKNAPRDGRRDGRPGDRPNNNNRDGRRDGRNPSKPAPAAALPVEPVAALEPSVTETVTDDATEALTVAHSIGAAVAEAVEAIATDETAAESTVDATDARDAAPTAEAVTAVDANAEAGEELVASEPVAPPPAKPLVRANEEREEDTRPRDADEVEREERLAASADMFPEEDDDEEPLLGGGAESDNNRRRRRRRRRGRGPDGAPETTAGADGAERAPGADASVEARPARPDEGREHRDNRDNRERNERRERDEAPRDDDTGRDAADMLVSLLTRRDDRQPVPMRALVDDALRSGRISGDPLMHVPALTAAARIDAVRRASRGERPRLRVTGGRVGLMDWTFPTELVRAEADALAALERLREAARRYVVRRLNELPQASFTEVVVMLLERMGVSSLKATRRPGLPQGEVHLAGVARRGPEELPLAVVVKRGGEVGRERVIEMRGSLHHYGPATTAWVVTTGNVLSGARDEAAQPGVAPVTLIDANALGRLLDENGVLVSHASVSLPWLDVDLYDMLRGS